MQKHTKKQIALSTLLYGKEGHSYDEQYEYIQNLLREDVIEEVKNSRETNGKYPPLNEK